MSTSRIICVSSLVLTLCACGSGPEAKSPTKTPHQLLGKAAPSVDSAAVPGPGRATNKHPGQVVVLDFWATYCGPCVKEFPQLQALADRHAGKVQVVGVSEDEEESAIAPFVTRTGVKFPVLWDKDKAFGGQYSVDSMPQTFVLDGEGVVRFVHRGYHAGEADELESEVKQLLAELVSSMEATAQARERTLRLLGCVLSLVVVSCRDPQKSTPSAATASVARATPSASPAPASSTQLRRLVRDERAMGTSVTVQTFAPDDSTLRRPASRIIDEAFLEIHRLEKLMSTWIPESEISQVNAHAAEHPVRVGADSLLVLEKSQWASEISHGVFDITFEVMHGLWRFDQDLDGKIPDAAAVEKLRANIDYRKVILDKAKSEVRLGSPETKINLGGIAKGYAIDRMAAALLDGGLTDFIVQAGGDLYAHGKKPDGSPWMVGTRDPRGPEGSFFGSVAVTDHAFSTAGDYERAFVKEGKRYHHIIDPRTGYPATASRSVTVWANDALTADAIDDAIFILGPEEGLPLCEAVPGCGVVLVDAHNRVWVSRRLEGVFAKGREPTDGI